jgi:hypothetical protein
MADYGGIAQVLLFAVMLWVAVAADVARWRARKRHLPHDRYALPVDDPPCGHVLQLGRGTMVARIPLH